MKKRNRIALLCLLFFCRMAVSFAQIDTSFWFAAPWVTPDHWWKDNYVLHISTFNTPNTVVKIRQPGITIASRYDTTINIPANSTFNYTFWRKKLAGPTTWGFDSLETRPANTVLPYGLYISSSSSVTLVYDVVTRSSNFLNPETFSLKGQNGLGTEFVCPFQTNWRNQNFSGAACNTNAQDLNCDGMVTQPKQQINIVATQSNTVVWITPRCNIVGHVAGVTYSVLLPSPGSAYTCENVVQNTNVVGNNLSGTIVVSDKPISVTVADDSVAGATGCFDLMGDQIVPVDVVGTDYILNKGFMNAAEFEGAYIVATANFTALRIEDALGVTTATINKGDTYYYKTTQSVTYVNANKNVYCLHATGTGCELGEALLPPLNCAGSDLVAFSRNTPQNFYLNILCKNGAQSTFTLNNSLGTVTVPITPANFTLVPGTGGLPGGPYYGCQLNLVSTTTLPVGSYTIGNTGNLFALGVLDGGATTGGLYHYMSSFLRKNVVTTGTVAPICAGQTFTVPLTGTVSGAAITGTWTTSGTGTFGVYSPSINVISTVYSLSNADFQQDSLTFYLTSLGDCNPVTDSVVLPIHQPPGVLPGLGTSMCKNFITPVSLSGTVTNAQSGVWSVSTGTAGGVFGPPGPVTTYTPSQADLTAGTITLTLLSQGPLGGCIDAAQSITVSFVDPANVDPGPDLTACTNSSTLALNGNITGVTSSGVWTTNGTGLFFPGSASPTATYQLSPGDLTLSQITLTLTSTLNGTLCAAVSSTMAINIIPKPLVTAPADFTVCVNPPVISLSGTVTGNALSGTWSSPGGSGGFDQQPPANASYTMGPGDITNGGATFVLTSAPGICPSETDTLKVAILDAPVVTVNSDNSAVCKNAPINLNGQVLGHTSSGVWSSTGTGAFSPTNTALGGQYLPSAGDVSNGNVVLTLSSTDNKGCPATSKSFTATFVPSPLASFNPSQKLCKNEGVLFTNTSQANGTDSLEYVWDFGDSSGVSIAVDPLHTFTNTGSYVITLTVTGNSALNVSCPDTTSKRVLINPTPVANYDFLNGCKDLITQFRDSSSVFGGSIVSWNWQFGDNSPVSAVKNPAHTYTASGTFNVLLTVTSNNLCTAFTSKLVTINPTPVAEFGLTNNPSVAQEPIYFSDFSTPTSTIKQWYWDFGDGGFDNVQAPSHIYADADIYQVTLTVTDDAGCSDTITKAIEVSLLPQVPSAFTPNKDGHNDLLFVKGGPFQTVTFKVYNSWGELVFETTDQKIGWDGTKNGTEQPVGTYVWTLVVDMYNNRQVKKNGDVTIIR